MIWSKITFLICSALYLNKFVGFGEVERKKNYPPKGQDSWRQSRWDSVIEACALVFTREPFFLTQKVY